MMNAAAFGFVDLEREIAITRRVLERLPEDRFGWKPHEKSMPLGRLAMHVATLLQWFRDTLELEGLDMAAPRPVRTEPTSKADLLQTCDSCAAAACAALERADAEALNHPWAVRNGSQVLAERPRAFILRTWCLNHLIHHRAQLCIYLRLLDIPVPAVYFNSADEPQWSFA